MRALRFGHQLRPAGAVEDVVAEARAAEAAGFDTVTIPDHINDTLLSPLILATAVAAGTDRIRIGTFVLNNEMRNPVQLAWEAATIDRLSHGRFELGIGAGHTPQEFAATGIPMRSAAERKARLGEAVEILRKLLDGETVTYQGEHYTVTNAAIEAPVQERLPILVGGNGRGLLTHAGQHADCVGLNGLRRTLEDGHRHTVGFSRERLERQIRWAREGAGASDNDPELNALVQRIEITDDREAAFDAAFADDPVIGLTREDGLTTPYLAFGTHAEIADQFRAAQSRWGISYFVTRNIEAMAPIIERIRG